MQKLKEEEAELHALMADAQRNLEQARRAVAAAKKDRGWSVPSTAASSTSTKGTTSMWFNNKGKGKPNMYAQAKGYHHFGGKGKDLGKKGYGKGKYKAYLTEGTPIQLMTMDVEGVTLDAENFYPMEELQAMTSQDVHPQIRDTEAVVDTGATVSAGGDEAVRNLVTALAKSQPDLQVTIVQSDQPYFRFGSGGWGRALYKCVLSTSDSKLKLQVYSLPSPGVPVLFGMRELQQLGMIMNLQTGNSIMLGQAITMRINTKKQLLLDLQDLLKERPRLQMQHVQLAEVWCADAIEPSSQNSCQHDSPEIFTTDVSVQSCRDNDCVQQFEMYPMQTTQVPRGETHVPIEVSSLLQGHLGVNSSQLQFLTQSRSVSSDLLSARPVSSHHGRRRNLRGDQEADHGSSQGGPEGNVGSRIHCDRDIIKGQGAFKASIDAGVRRDPEDDGGQVRPPSASGSMAMLQSTFHRVRPEQICKMGPVQSVRSPSDVCAGGVGPSEQPSCGSSGACGNSSGHFAESGMDSTVPIGEDGEGPDQGDLLNACHRGRSQEGRCEGFAIQDREEEQGAGGLRDTRQLGRRLLSGGSISRKGRSESADECREEGEGSDEEVNFVESVPEMVTEKILDAMKLQPLDLARQFRELKRTVADVNLWEICCAPNSTLTAECQRVGFQAERFSLHNGYDVDSERCINYLCLQVSQKKPTKLWAATKCTPWTSIQNMNQRTPEQIERLKRLRQKSRRQVRGVVKVFKEAVNRSPEAVDIYFEWPTRASAGWSIPELTEFKQWLMKCHGKQLYFCRIDGCMVGLTDGGSRKPIHKPWTIMTTDYDFYCKAWCTCDGQHDHEPLFGSGSVKVSQSAFYPPAMARRIVQIWKGAQHADTSQRIAQELHVLDSEIQTFFPTERATSSGQKRAAVELEGADMDTEHAETDVDMPMASSSAIPAQAGAAQQEEEEDVPTVEREKGRALLHKLHRAAGHPSNKALARLCRDRKLPKWIIKEAEQLQCPACVSAERGTLPVPRKSLGQQPVPWQFVGLDVLELAMPAQQQKSRYLLMTCLCMRFVSVVHLWTGSLSDAGTDPGPRLIEAFCNGWLMHRPRPEWCIVDSQSSLRFGAVPTFLAHAGIGMTVVPGEAHWMHGKTEAMVQVLKRTMRRIRNEYPTLAPHSLAALATYAQNHTDRVSGFSPIQWAYGVDPDGYDRAEDPLLVNRDKQLGPEVFQDLHRLRDRASAISIEERARESFVRLLNSSPKPLVDYRVGDLVCIWRNMTLRARKRDENYNPEARFIGPGRIVLIEPALFEDRKEGIIWVLFGTTLYRCAVEQLRPASQQEVTLELLKGGTIMTVPKTELLKRLKTYVDVSREQLQPDHPEYQSRERSRSRERRRKVDELRTTWDELVGINEARRKDGLPPLMSLPVRVQAENFPQQPEVHNMAEFDDQIPAETPEQHAQPSEILHMLRERIYQLEQEEKYRREGDELRAQVEHERASEQELMFTLQSLSRNPELKAFFVEFDIENADALITNPLLYTKHVLESKSAEVTYRHLREDEKPLFDEAKARELSEVASSQCLRAVTSRDELREAYNSLDRHIPMRWVLTWKPVIPPEPPSGHGPTTFSPDGTRKAKARVVLIGFKHPDLAKRNPLTGKPELLTSSPTISRTGRNLLLQSMAFDHHRMESADAKSAFLQAESKEERRRLWTRGVPELAVAFGMSEARLFRILGAIYGLTNAPRIFWSDADSKFKALGGVPHALDRCVWLFKDKFGSVCGRVGSQVDDFLIGGNEHSSCWQRVRASIKNMYNWSPWQAGDFIYSGSRLRQLSNYSIHVSQEDFCNALRPVEIANDKVRADDDLMSETELSQCRALLMKGQWRALQTAPQYAARIGIATSVMKDKRLSNLREANSIVRELKKRSKEDLVFHSFHESFHKPLTYKDLVFVHWADAGQPSFRRGGYVTGLTTPRIMQGVETPVSLVDWKSWKLKRPSVGTNASEGQALYEAEDKGWRSRLFWALLYGHELSFGKADELTSLFTSLLVTDSKGCYDLLTMNESLGMSTENSKTATDLLSVKYGIRDGSNCFLTWVPGDINLADGLTKVTNESFKTMALYHERKAWIIRFNDEFVSARKQQRLRREQLKAEAASNMHFADLPELWAEDSWSGIFCAAYQR